MKYNTVILAELLQPKGYIRGPFGSALKRGEMLSVGIPVYEQQHAIYNNRVFRFFISEKKLEEMNRFQVKENDLIISCSGTVGKVSIIGKDDPKGIISQALLLLRTDREKVLPQYLKYYFDSAEGYNAIVSRSSGSVQVNIAKREVIENIPILIPNIETQQKVISILTVIDKKIEKNNAINDKLAELLQTLYQERFGDVSSTTTQGMLSDICSYSRDKVAVSKLDFNTYFSTENMLPQKAGATEATSLPTTSQTPACHKGDTLISNIRPYFKKIVYCQSECGCSTDVLCFTPSKSHYSAYLFSTLYADKFFAFMVAGSKGTKMPRGDKQQIMTYPIAIPSDAELNAFNSVAQPVLTQIHDNQREDKRLSEMRDAILPKLMSGEIDVSSIQL